MTTKATDSCPLPQRRHCRPRQPDRERERLASDADGLPLAGFEHAVSSGPALAGSDSDFGSDRERGGPIAAHGQRDCTPVHWPDRLPGTYAACPTCHGARYNPETLEVRYRDRNIAEVLDMTVDKASEFLADVRPAARSLDTLREVGLGYLRLGQPATELSGGEAQRIKLATELQRGRRGHALYVLDEPTTGLHPADIELLLRQLHRLVDAGNTVVAVEHEMNVVARADWVIDLGPGAGDEGGRIVAAGMPADVARERGSKTAPYLAVRLRS